MFNIQSAAAADSSNYDFTKEENAAKWQGLFVASLRRVLEQLHPSLNAGDDALLYVESLCLHLLGLLCAKPSPHSINDIAERVGKTFPNPIENWALKEAHDTVDKSKKSKKSVLPVEKIHSLLCKEVLQYKIDLSVGTFMVAVLEYISADILKLAGNYVKNIRHVEILREDIKIAMCADKVLMDMFSQDASGNASMQISPLPPTPRDALSYEDVVKELIHEEKQYQRELHMIIRVFREELAKVVKDPVELEPIFANITDIYELTVTLLGSLEDVIEMAQEEAAPCVGNCFEELAEGEEFEVYSRYAREITSAESRDALQSLLNRHDSSKLTTAGHGFREAVKFYLPKLLLGPIWHAFLYLDYVKMLLELSSNREDRESFEQVQGLLKPMQCELSRAILTLPKESIVQVQSRTRRQLAIEKVKELQNTVDFWDKDMAGTNCNEFIRADALQIISKRNVTDRKVYLFDGLMVMCKANARRQVITTIVQTNLEYRLKEKFHMRRVEIIDRSDTDGMTNAFEIAPRGNSAATVVVAKSPQQKNEWMADLVMVTTKSMLDRILDSILLDIEKKHPLRMPSPEIYKFAVPDAPDNIVLEERESTGVPLIKGATLCKLIERLTYHIYADPMFVRTFLTTYRSFCSPHELLQLLLERFNIPDPSQVYEPISERDLETDKIHKNMQREDWKRYKKEYVQPVQFRVLNVLRHWVDHHFYDFDNDRGLLSQLLEFLETVSGKSMRKWVDSVLKIVQRKKEQEANHKQITFAFGSSPPPIESHLKVHESEITLLTLHPIELARQLTLLEFELYKTVKPSELVGKVWTTSKKDTCSPNLLKIIKHTTNFTRWIEKSILDAENFEERVAMFSRAIEVMTVLLDLNNFNSVISIASAIAGAAVFRLNVTKAAISARQRNVLDDCLNLTVDHSRRYQEKLRSINPPCVPFFGMYLTNILHLEEGNLDLLANTELINFSKRRKVAETIGEIQQYQNQPYCLKVDPSIRRFLENLDPYDGLPDEKIPDLVWAESNRVEPKDVRPLPKFPRRWPDINLKSPGIKPRRQNQSNNSSSSSNSMSIPGTLPFSSKTHQHHLQSHATTGATTTATTTTSTTSTSTSTATTDGDQSPHTAHIIAAGNQTHSSIGSFSYSLSSSASTFSCSTAGDSHSVATAEPTTDPHHPAAAASSPAPQLPKRSNSITSLSNSSATDTKPVLSPRAFDHHIHHPQHLHHHVHHPHQHQQYHPAAVPSASMPHHHHHAHHQPHHHPHHQHHQATGGGGGATPTATTACRYQPVVSPKCMDVLPEDSGPAAARGTTTGDDMPPAISPRTDKYCIATHLGTMHTDSAAGAASHRHNSGIVGSAMTTSSTPGAGGYGDMDATAPLPTPGPIPLSPHVNVPQVQSWQRAGHQHAHPHHQHPHHQQHQLHHSQQHGVVPPPLPPRVPRRDGDMAQQRQAADAPMLPPRDLSPPPLPPRRICRPPDPAAANAFGSSLQHHHHHHPHHHLPATATSPRHLHAHNLHQMQQQQQHHHHPHSTAYAPNSSSGCSAATKLQSTCDMVPPTSTAPPPPICAPPQQSSASASSSSSSATTVTSANTTATSLQLINTSQIMRRRSSAMDRAVPTKPGGAQSEPNAAAITTTATPAAATAGTATTATATPATSTLSPPSHGGEIVIVGAVAAATESSNPFRSAAAPSIVPPPAPRRLSTTVSPRFSPGETTPRLPPKPKNFLAHNNGATMFPYPSATVTTAASNTDNTHTLPL